ncbi:hypothetical protein B6U93_00655 [Candidatus Woesearchaeota archaeon ex4484_78]|nr:MAG: hypothetical protein B6U93_00655 [Candidatus Woesearchaeota archaeon ex4484_78]
MSLAYEFSKTGNRSPKICIVGCVQGNELVGKKTIEKLKKIKIKKGTIGFLIANVLAMKKKRRFIEIDLNRAFPGNSKGKYEEELALKIKKIVNKFDYVIDLHSSSTKTPPFVIIPNKKKENEKLAIATNVKRIVYTKKRIAKKRAMLDHVKNGIAIELGLHEMKSTETAGLKAVLNILKYLKMIDGKWKNQNNRERFVIDEELKLPSKKAKIKIRNFEIVQKGEEIAEGKSYKIIAKKEFYPILAGEKAYPDFLCYVGIKINQK